MPYLILYLLSFEREMFCPMCAFIFVPSPFFMFITVCLDFAFSLSSIFLYQISLVFLSLAFFIKKKTQNAK